MDGQGDRAQMLLLTAIILAIGFIALAGMAARIDQIPDDAEASQEGRFFTEVDLVVAGASEAMDSLADDATEPLGNATFQDALDGALAHLVHTERARGYLMEVGSVSCSMVGGDARLELPVTIASIQDQAMLTVVRDYAGLTCT